MTRVSVLLTLAALVACLGGCREEEGIRHYTVPKQSAIDRLANSGDESGSKEAVGRQRMLAAIVLRPSQGWFFKLMGPEDTVNKQTEGFSGFLKSLHFADDGTPQWSLPEGWRQQPGNQFRYATLTIGDAGLEVSVSSLPRGESDASEYVLNNVNRWRGQLGLADLSPDELQRETTQAELNGDTATLVDLVGEAKDDAMMRAPFASRGLAAPRAATGDGETPRLKYEVPTGWRQEPASGFRKASFRLAEGDLSGEVLVTDLDLAAGDLLPNVNRWRGQIGLEPTTEREMEQRVEPIDVGTNHGDYIEMLGDTKATIAVIVKAAGRAWFIKLTGDRGLVERQRDHFKSFVHSLTIGEAEGANDGK